VFGSLLALLPLLIAAVSIMTTFVINAGLTYLTSISFVVEFLIALVGLGVAIDYSLLVSPGGARNGPGGWTTPRR